MTRCLTSVLTIASIVTVAGLAAPAGARPVVYTTVALTGTDGPLGPGMGTGVTFTDIGGQQPSLNNSGQVAFRGNASTAGTPQGLWLHTAGVNNNLAMAGGAMPGGGTYTAGSTGIINSMLVNQQGHVAFRLGASTGLFGDSGAGMGRLMLTGDFAPGTSTGTLATYASSASGMPLLNHNGQSAFIANLAASTVPDPDVVFTSGIANAAGVWIGTPGAGNQSLAMRQNDTLLAVDPSGNTRVGALSGNLTLSFNDNAHFIMQGALQGSNVTTGTGAGSNSTAMFSNIGGTVGLLARAGSAAPDAAGAPSATDLFRNFSTGGVAINNNGRVAFSGTLRNAAGTQTSTGAFFSDHQGGVLRQVARFGDALPSVYAANDSSASSPLAEFAGVTWGFSYNNVVMNNGDLLVFTATGLGNTGGTNNRDAVLSRDASGVLRKILRSGDVAVANDPLSTDFSNTRFLGVSNVQLNALGQMAMSVTLTGTGVSVGLGNGVAIFGCDAGGPLQLIARTGDFFTVAPGDVRVIASIGGLTNSGGHDGRAVMLNDRGVLAFELNFVGGTSGIFTATVPAPAAGALLALAGLAGARRRRTV